MCFSGRVHNFFRFVSDFRSIIRFGELAMKILVIEDERLLADTLCQLLSAHGFGADTAFDGESGLEYALSGVYDLIILDVMLPGIDGFSLARRLRAERVGTPILMLTARSGLDDRVEGLDSGADYYLTKPFETRELMACVNAILRRQGAQVDELSFGGTSLDLATAELVCQGRSVHLSAKEFELARCLFSAGDRIVSKQTLRVKVWGWDSDAVENHVEVYVGFLRKKLTGISSGVHIRSVRSLGYYLEAET